jgi:hypothetical protein
MAVGIQIMFSFIGAILGFFTGSKFSCDTFACFFKSNRWGRLMYFGAIGFIIARLFVDLHPFGWFS